MKITLGTTFTDVLNLDVAKPDVYTVTVTESGMGVSVAIHNKAETAATLRRVADELDPPMPSHEITIVDDPMGHKAECSCGWASAGWESYALAVDLGTDHVADMLEEERAGV